MKYCFINSHECKNSLFQTMQYFSTSYHGEINNEKIVHRDIRLTILSIEGMYETFAGNAMWICLIKDKQ